MNSSPPANNSASRSPSLRPQGAPSGNHVQPETKAHSLPSEASRPMAIDAASATSVQFNQPPLHLASSGPPVPANESHESMCSRLEQATSSVLSSSQGDAGVYIKSLMEAADIYQTIIGQTGSSSSGVSPEVKALKALKESAQAWVADCKLINPVNKWALWTTCQKLGSSRSVLRAIERLPQPPSDGTSSIHTDIPPHPWEGGSLEILLSALQIVNSLASLLKHCDAKMLAATHSHVHQLVSHDKTYLEDYAKSRTAVHSLQTEQRLAQLNAWLDKLENGYPPNLPTLVEKMGGLASRIYGLNGPKMSAVMMSELCQLEQMGPLGPDDKWGLDQIYTGLALSFSSIPKMPNQNDVTTIETCKAMLYMTEFDHLCNEIERSSNNDAIDHPARKGGTALLTEQERSSLIGYRKRYHEEFHRVLGESLQLGAALTKSSMRTDTASVFAQQGFVSDKHAEFFRLCPVWVKALEQGTPIDTVEVNRVLSQIPSTRSIQVPEAYSNAALKTLLLDVLHQLSDESIDAVRPKLVENRPEYLMDTAEVQRRLARFPAAKAPEMEAADDLSAVPSDNAGPRPPLFGPLGDWEFTSDRWFPLAKPGFENSVDTDPMGELVHVLKKGDISMQVTLNEMKILRLLNKNGPVPQAELRDAIGGSDPNAVLDGMRGVLKGLGVTLVREGDMCQLKLNTEEAAVAIHVAESKHPG